MNPWPVDAEVDEVHLPRPGHADLPACSSTATPTCATCSSAHRRARRRRGSPRARSPRRCCALGVIVLSHVTRIGRSPLPSATTCARRTSRTWTSRPCAASTMTAERGDGGRDRHRPQGERVARRRVRGARLRAGARDRLAHLLGGAPRRPAGRRDHVDPGDEGRRDRRRLRPRRAGRLAGPRRDLLVRGAGLLPRDQPRRRRRGRHDHRRPARGAGGHEAAAHAHQAAAQRRHRHQAPAPRCASAPTRARCPPRASWARRWWRLVLAAAYREKLGGDHIDDTRAALRAYEERIGWSRS